MLYSCNKYSLNIIMNNDKDIYFRLLANPNKLIVKKQKNKVNYLKLYIHKKFDKIDTKYIDTIFNIVDRYINNIDITDIIINDILNTIISDIVYGDIIKEIDSTIIGRDDSE